jgi:hypothetical protein
MSVRISSVVWESPLKGSDLILMLALADHSDDEGVCWPSIPKVAKKARMSERTAQRACVRLRDAGYLRIDYNRGSRSGSNKFTLFPRGAAPQYPQVEDGDILTPVGGDNLTPVTPDDTGGVTQLCHQGGDTVMSPESSVNHQGNIKRGRKPSATPRNKNIRHCPKHYSESADNCKACRVDAMIAERNRMREQNRVSRPASAA